MGYIYVTTDAQVDGTCSDTKSDPN